jgi:hypothetical protein
VPGFDNLHQEDDQAEGDTYLTRIDRGLSPWWPDNYSDLLDPLTAFNQPNFEPIEILGVSIIGITEGGPGKRIITNSDGLTTFRLHRHRASKIPGTASKLAPTQHGNPPVPGTKNWTYLLAFPNPQDAAGTRMKRGRLNVLPASLLDKEQALNFEPMFQTIQTGGEYPGNPHFRERNLVPFNYPKTLGPRESSGLGLNPQQPPPPLWRIELFVSLIC